MKTHRILLMLAGIVAALQIKVAAQSVNDTAMLFTEMKHIQSVYQANPVSFDVKYTYASEIRPEIILDSLQGKMELAGKNTYYLLDSTETFFNERYGIILFKQDKIMFLTKPSTVSREDPAQQMRTVMEKSGIKGCRITSKDNIKTIQVDFEGGGPYRKMEMMLDPVSGYIKTIRYIVKTALLMGAGADIAAAADEYGEYAIVQTFFDQYKKIKPDDARFDERNFFYKKGETFEVTPAYDDYKIFTGSPNL